MIECPLIVVSQRVDYSPTRDEFRDGLDQRLAEWIIALGGLPVPVPNKLGDNLENWLTAVRPTAVLLSGGNDIGESNERDRTETVLLRKAERDQLPVLGICRGMQMLVHYAGGALNLVTDHVGVRHALHGHEVTCGALPREVNSFHNWGLHRCPPDYVALATAPDGRSIEAMRHRNLRWEGWMWHPEREGAFGEIDLARARQLLIREQ